MSDYDAAFGPMGAVTLAGLDAESVKTLQRNLNSLGYGPLDVDGIIGPMTTKAAQAFWNERGPGGEVPFDANLTNTVAKHAKAGGTIGGNVKYEVPAGGSVPVAQPFYKKPAFLFGALALAGVVGYVAWRANGSSLGGVDASLSAADELATERKKRRTKRDAAEKCGRTPDVDFDDGEEFERDAPTLPSLPHAVPVES